MQSSFISLQSMDKGQQHQNLRDFIEQTDNLQSVEQKTEQLKQNAQMIESAHTRMQNEKRRAACCFFCFLTCCFPHLCDK